MTLRSQTIKMSQTVIVNFETVNRIEFTFTIRVHHLYKITWFSVINEKLDSKEDDQEEALSCDKYATGVFKKDGTLAGHIAIKISNLIDYFLKDGEENCGCRVKKSWTCCSYEIYGYQNILILN